MTMREKYTEMQLAGEKGRDKMSESFFLLLIKEGGIFFSSTACCCSYLSCLFSSFCVFLFLLLVCISHVAYATDKEIKKQKKKSRK